MEKDLINLAKGGKPTKATKKVVKKTVPKKTAPKKVVEKKLTAEEERDIKAKKTVEKLLENSPIVNLDKKEEDMEIPTRTTETPKGFDWIEEQVAILTSKNEKLTNELAESKNDYQKLYNSKGNVGAPDDEVVASVYKLFNELQENHIRMGVNPQTGVGNFRIYCPGFLNRLIKFFPFLEDQKRF